MSAGVLIQWENNEVGLPSPSLSPAGPDGLGWQIRQRIWGARDCPTACERVGKSRGTKEVCWRVGKAHRRLAETRGFRVAITPKGSIL